MKRQRLGNSPLVLGLAFVGAMVATFIATRSYGLPVLATGLPGLHGLLTARSVLPHQQPTALPGLRNRTLEIICAGLLGLALGIIVVGKLSIFGLLIGWGVAAIATLSLVIATALELLQTKHQNRPLGSVRTRLIHHSCALLAYSLLVAWIASVFSLWLVHWLSGEPYMGN